MFRDHSMQEISAKLIKRIMMVFRFLHSPKRALRYAQFLRYHKFTFGITNTKFDISFCVFRESFLNDQYGIRRFLTRIAPAKELFFLDIGRNHGFVFYYTMFFIMKHNFKVSVINYYGVDPSPLKFVYFNYHKFLNASGITIKYHLINRAVVFEPRTTVSLKYGENNYGNFNVSGSNYEQKSARRYERKSARRRLLREYVDVLVETIQFTELQDLLRNNMGSHAVIVKIDCKNRTDWLFTQFLETLENCSTNYLVSCERDGSSGQDVSAYYQKGLNTLSKSQIVEK